MILGGWGEELTLKLRPGGKVAFNLLDLKFKGMILKFSPFSLQRKKLFSLKIDIKEECESLNVFTALGNIKCSFYHCLTQLLLRRSGMSLLFWLQVACLMFLVKYIDTVFGINTFRCEV